MALTSWLRYFLPTVLLSSSNNDQQKPFYDTTDASCRTSHVGRYDMARGRSQVPTITSTPPSHEWHWEQPAISPMNGTAGEQWEFDGVSSDGSQSFIVGLYRDPNYAFLGTGNLRAYVEFTLADGSRYAVVDYAEEAIITTCPGSGTHGVWRGPEFEYTFDVAEDMSTARWSMTSAEMNATVDMRSMSRPRYPSNRLWSTGEEDKTGRESAQVVPHFFWLEPIPTAAIKATISVRDKALSWTGVGGHERLWGAFNWRTCIRNMKIVRLQAGPYSLSLWEFGSSRIPNSTFTSVALFEGGNKVLGVADTTYGETSAEVQVVTEGGDQLVLRKLYGVVGNTTEHLKDKATGVELRLRSDSLRREWAFTVTFSKVAFEYVLTEGRGGTGYAGTAVGGLVNGSSDQGPALVEIMRFPDGDWWLLPNNYVE